MISVLIPSIMAMVKEMKDRNKLKALEFMLECKKNNVIPNIATEQILKEILDKEA
jgi:hypothetical protein